MNQCNFIGRLTKDVELLYGQSGTAIGKFSLAVNRKFKDKETVSYFDFTAFGKTGELVAQYFKKGDAILVSSRAEQETWDKDGIKHSKISFVVENIEFLPSNNKNLEKGEKQSQTSNKAKKQEDIVSEIEEEVPF